MLKKGSKVSTLANTAPKALESPSSLTAPAWITPGSLRPQQHAEEGRSRQRDVRALRQVPTSALVAELLRRVGLPRERLRRDVIKLEYRLCGRCGRPRVSGQRRNGALRDRVAVGGGRGDHPARSIEDEGSGVGAGGLLPQQVGEAVAMAQSGLPRGLEH